MTVSLAAQAPQNCDTSFTEQYGTQELNAVPVDAGQTKDVKLKVTPPNTAAAGDYKVTARAAAEDASATSDLDMTITGQPRLDISGREGLVSTRASAGKETSVPVVITTSYPHIRLYRRIVSHTIVEYAWPRCGALFT